jgi:hypothetical protein
MVGCGFEHQIPGCIELAGLGHIHPDRIAGNPVRCDNPQLLTQRNSVHTIVR